MQVREQERSSVLLLAFYFFFAMTSTSIVKSLQNALYLGSTRFDWRLPLLYVAIALLSIPVVFFYRSRARRGSQLILSSITLLVFLSTFLAFWFLFRTSPPWIYGAFYVWAGLFTVLLPLQGWMVSYDFYGTRAAKRVFAILGAGGIVGGAFGGYYSAAQAAVVGNHQLMLHVCVLLVALQLLLIVIYRRHEPIQTAEPGEDSIQGEPEAETGSFNPFRKFLQSPYLTNLAGLVLIMGLTTTVIDLQYKAALDQAFPRSAEQITEFFGILLGTIFVFSALFQIFVTSTLLRRYGVGVGILVLPVALLGGSIGVAIGLAFWSVIALKVIDGGLRTSVDRTSVELLYVPVADGDTASTKSLIDVGIFRLGDALGAALFVLLYLTTNGSEIVRAAAIAVALAALVWVFISYRINREYVPALRHSLQVRTTRSNRPSLETKEASVDLHVLLNALRSDQPAKVRFALDQLIRKNRDDVDAIQEFGASGEETLQTRLSGVYSRPRPAWFNQVSALVNHVDPQIGAAALHILIQYQPSHYLREIRENLSGGGPPRARFLIYLYRYGRNPAAYLDPTRVQRWSRQLPPEHVALLARLLGKTRDPRFKPVLESWLDSPPRTRALAAMEALGNYCERDYLKLMVGSLEKAWSRGAAQRALVCSFKSAVEPLAEVLRDAQVSLAAKREVPLILARINTPAARSALITALYQSDQTITYRALKGLNKIRGRRPLPYTMETFEPLLQLWLRQYYELVNLEILLPDKDLPGIRLLRKALAERIAWKLEMIFRGLGLFFPYEDAYFSYVGYTGDQQRLRENAIELIDAHLKGELRQTLLPIFTEIDQEAITRLGRQLFSLPDQLDEALGDVLFQEDPWLKCCILAASVEVTSDSLAERIRRAGEDTHPLVRETAAWAAGLLAAGAPSLHRL